LCYEYSEKLIVQRAICFFFNVVTLGRNVSSSRGLNEKIIPIYIQSSETSPIPLAVSAVSTSLFGMYNKDNKTQAIASNYLSAALNRLQDCLNEHVERQRDKNLMTCVLLQFHETMHAVRQSRAAIPVHQNGAMSLVR
jgi:hypothetical protein